MALPLVNFGVTADEAKGDLKTLQGSWDLIYFERNGKEIKLQNNTRTINTGDKFIVKRGDQVVAAGIMKVDPSKKPKTSETTYTQGPDKGKTFKGIYKFDGDTVRFCRAGSPDDERSTGFKTKPGSGRFVAVYKRSKQ